MNKTTENKQNVIEIFDEETLEELYWEFDTQRKKNPENERLIFKSKLRYYLGHELRRRCLDFPLEYALNSKQDTLYGEEFADYLLQKFNIKVIKD